MSVIVLKNAIFLISSSKPYKVTQMLQSRIT
jgi:hypothetical protein